MLYTEEIEMDNIYEVSLLLDFYGQLLTKRQYEILDLHYNNDYSLGEIGEYFNISRQGVYDNIKRGKAVLDNYERKLGLVRKFTEQKHKVEEILVYLRKIDREKLSCADKQNLSKIEEGITDIISKF